jgi:hypothetical protein
MSNSNPQRNFPLSIRPDQIETPAEEIRREFLVLALAPPIGCAHRNPLKQFCAKK